MLRFIAILLLSFPLAVSAQHDHCATEHVSKNSQQHATIRAKRNAVIAAADAWMKKHPQRSATTLIVPVVFHIFHEGGQENISKAQILDQLRILNEDFQRLNADTINTPVPFQAVAANCQVEFRLAQLDPNGNCTDGIVRIKTGKTVNATDDVKDLSSWDNDRYLNIWVVKSIYNFTGSAGTILGYAYYPGTAPFGYDGCIVRADYIGSFGYVAPRSIGRTATHEVGHYLDLAHVWGDFQCGDDFVNDTPVALGPNGGCPAFPRLTPSCNPGPDGEMFVNYMDYTDDYCMNTFTYGQKQRMDATFANFRSLLVDPSNHVFTGVLNSPVACTMVPDFRANKRVICAGDSIQFTDQSWNGDPASRTWTFSGGVTTSSSDSITWVTFPSPGIYDASITVSNAAGSVTKNESQFIIVKPASQANANYSENFDNGFVFASSGMDQFSSGTPFNLTSVAAASGNHSLIRETAVAVGDTLTALVLPSLDLTGVTMPYLRFKIAAALQDISSTAVLRMEISPNCGQTWQLRYQRKGSALATTSLITNGFIPDSASWRQENVSIAPVAGNPNALVRFILSSSLLDNFYLDDINVNATPTGIGMVSAEEQLLVYPNPSNGTFTVEVPDDAILHITDLSGKQIREQVAVKGLNAIELNIAPGIYFLQYKNSTVKLSIQ